ISRRRARPELHVHRGAQAEGLVHLRHPSPEHAHAPDVQGRVRAVDGSRRFARPRPPKTDTTMTANALFAAFGASPPDSTMLRRNIAAIRDRLIKHHGFKLSDDDVRTISYVYEAFVSAGPDLTYNFGPRGMNGFGRGRMPTYADLQIEHDSVGAQ